MSQPNFIVILTDDMGYNDLGCFNSTCIKTPRIDGMAGEGLKLTSFYAAAGWNYRRIPPGVLLLLPVHPSARGPQRKVEAAAATAGQAVGVGLVWCHAPRRDQGDHPF